MLSRHRTGGRFKCDPDDKRFGRSDALWAGHGGGRGSGILSLASLDLDFTKNTGRAPSGATRSASSFLSTTRASDAYADNSAGVWPLFGSGVPRITDKGLWREDSRTNSIRNNSMQGAVAGSPGTPPTNWFPASTGGVLTRTIVGAGTEDGIDYIDFRYQFSGSGSASVQFESGSQVAATSGQVWTSSAFVKIVGGSLTNFDPFEVSVIENNSSGAFLTGGDTTFTPTTDALGEQRYSHTRTLNNASTAYVYSRVELNATGAADITLRIGWPQLELGAVATSPIRTTSAAATRAADRIRTSDISWFNPTEGTFFFEGSLSNPANGANQFAIRMSDNSYGNAIALNITSTGKVAIVTAAASVFDGNAEALAAISANTTFKVAGSYKANNLNISLNGATVVKDTSATIPTGLTRCDIGSDHAGLNDWDAGIFRRIGYLPIQVSEAQLQALAS